MQIRPAKESDYKDLMSLYNLFVESDRFSNYDNDSLKVVLDRDDYFIYVAEEDAKLIGFITFSTRSVVRYPRPIAQLEEFFVHVDFRNMGIGKELIAEMENKAKELNLFSIFIESREDKKVAHEIYQKLGYKKSGFYFRKDL